MANLKVALFDKNIHDRKDFSCGVVNVDNWFKHSISKQIKRDRVRVWCGLNDAGVLVGFYALSAYSIPLEEAGSLAYPDDRHEIPAIYLNFMGVDVKHQGKRVGSRLLGDVIKQCSDISDTIGVSAIVLDVNAGDNFASRVDFYERYGFRVFEGWETRMALHIQTARLSL